MNLDFTGSTLFLVLLLFAAGLVCIIKGGDIFVDAATWIAEASGIPKFIIGATVVSFATTMPEMLVSVFSALEGNADIAVGNAVGSVTANTGLILCISLVCMQCVMTRRQYAGKACLLLSAICLLFVFTRDGSLSLWESAAILAVFVFYMAESLLAGRREQGAEQPAEKPKKDGRTVAWNIGKFVLGAAAIVLGAQLLIDNGSELARRIGADVVIGTDPDCDRIGCAVAAGDEFRLLSGNQIGALLTDFVLSHRALTPKSTMITTIVTGELGARVAQSRGVTVLRTLTGFKYIGEKITEFARSGEREFLFGYEESYGYLAGTHAQDKDAVVAAMLICEMAAAAKSKGRTLIDELNGLYARFGYYLDAQDSHTLKGKDGAERIAAMMARLRGGARFEGVSQTLDYAQGLDGLPRENVMKFLCADGSWFAVRPSGTEPKIKIYYSIKDTDETSAGAKLDARRAEVGGVLGL